MIESIKILDKELIDIKNAALSSNLKPLPGENVSQIFSLLDFLRVQIINFKRNFLFFDKINQSFI